MISAEYMKKSNEKYIKEKVKNKIKVYIKKVNEENKS